MVYLKNLMRIIAPRRLQSSSWSPRRAMKVGLKMSVLAILLIGIAQLWQEGDTTNRSEGSLSDLGIGSSQRSLAQTASYRDPVTTVEKVPTARGATHNSSSSSSWPPSDIVDAVMDDRRRVIVVGVNCGYMYLADNFLHSLVLRGVSNFIIVPMDTKTHNTLSDAYPGHVVPILPALEGLELEVQGDYDSPTFTTITSTRPTFLLRFLEKDYSVLYSDVDVVWRMDAFQHVPQLETSDMLLVHGVDTTAEDAVCTSTIFMKPTIANKNFTRAWKYEMEKGSHKNDQYGFNSIFRRQKNTLRYVWGAPDKFPSARNFFSRRAPLWRRKKAVVVHNNGKRYKHMKMSRFIEFNLWYPSHKLKRYVCDNLGNFTSPELPSPSNPSKI